MVASQLPKKPVFPHRLPPDKTVLQCISSLFTKISCCLPSEEWGWGVKHNKGRFVWKKYYINENMQKSARLPRDSYTLAHPWRHSSCSSHYCSLPCLFPCRKPRGHQHMTQGTGVPLNIQNVSTLLTSPFTELLSYFTRHQQSPPIPAATRANFSHRICSKVKCREFAFFYYY